MDKLNEQDKARLIKMASRFASISVYEHSNGDISYYSEKTEVRTEVLIALAKAALAALTAQPVKLPNCVDDLHGIGPVMSADEVESAIRAAGYEVEE